MSVRHEKAPEAATTEAFGNFVTISLERTHYAIYHGLHPKKIP